MNLYDPQRPKLLNNKLTWQRNHIAIPNLELFPLENGLISVSIFLPIKEGKFTSRRFSTHLKPEDIYALLINFKNDPEETCEYLFKTQEVEDSISNSLSPELRNETPYDNREQTPNTQQPTTNIKKKSPTTFNITL